MPTSDDNVSDPPSSGESGINRLIEIQHQSLEGLDWDKLVLAIGSVEVDGEVYIKSIFFETRTEDGQSKLYRRIGYAKVDINNISGLLDRNSFVESLPVSKQGIEPIHRDINDQTGTVVLGTSQRIESEIKIEDLFNVNKNKFSINPGIYGAQGWLLMETEEKPQNLFLDSKTFLIPPMVDNQNDDGPQHP